MVIRKGRFARYLSEKKRKKKGAERIYILKEKKKGVKLYRFPLLITGKKRSVEVLFCEIRRCLF